MKSNLTWARPVLVAIAIAMGVMGAGCSKESVFCDQFCACEGCSESQEQECVQELKGTRAYAEDAGCATEYEALINCEESMGTCVDQTWSFGPCADQNDAFSDCLGGGGE